MLFYVDQADQQWYRVEVGSMAPPAEPVAPTALGGVLPTGSTDGTDGTEGPERSGAWTTRYADGRVTRSGMWLVSVEERHRDGRTDHRLVAHRTGSRPEPGLGAGTGPELRVVSLVAEWDFVAAPRPSPDGRWLAWMCWDHPFMPWDRSELWVAALEESAGTIRLHDRRRVAGGGESSVGQPRWGRDGSLFFVDDRTGWWMPYRLAADAVGDDASPPEQLVGMDAEFHAPDWVLGQSTMAERSDGSLVGRMHRVAATRWSSSVPGLVAGDAAGRFWSVAAIDQPCVAVAGLAIVTAADDPSGTGERLLVLGSTPTESPAVWDIPWPGQGPARRISTGSGSPLSASRGVRSPDRSRRRRRTAPSPASSTPRPVHHRMPPAGPPPLVVFCHGGPTSAADAGLDPVVQFFTSRGLAVAAVNYRGSSGYGRAYRKRLDGRWGEADVDDCVRLRRRPSRRPGWWTGAAWPSGAPAPVG